jgi:transcriptional regulator
MTLKKLVYLPQKKKTMFIPEHYKNNDTEEIKTFLQTNSFGILINTVNGKPWGTHIPLEIGVNSTGEEVLVGHIAKANPQSKNLVDGDEVLCIFNGPHSYVSSSWYQQEEVPTWNYIAVHVYGSVRLQTSAELHEALHELVDKHEKASEHPIALDDMSRKTMRQVSGIIGFEIHIQDIQAVKKLSQGRERDHPKIMEELIKQDQGAMAIAREMKKL